MKGRLTEDGGREIPIPDDALGRLKSHLRERQIQDISGYVATAPHGGPIRYDNWRRRTWHKVTALAGIDASPHDLRKTAATRLFLKDRWTVGEVQAFLGHRDPRTTLAIYTLINAASLPRPSELDVETG